MTATPDFTTEQARLEHALSEEGLGHDDPILGHRTWGGGSRWSTSIRIEGASLPGDHLNPIYFAMQNPNRVGQFPLLQLWKMDVLLALRHLPSNSVHVVVCSPPYWKLRDYGFPGQIGHESTLAEHIAVLVEVFREVRRVLHPSGTLWVNYGDVYAQHGRPSCENELFGDAVRTHRRGYSSDAFAGYAGWQRGAGTASKQHPPKSLLMIPHRLAIALQDDGWVVRSDQVWSKRNPLPESAKDRPARTHEYFFQLVKRPRNYFYDPYCLREAEREMPDGATWGRQLRSVWHVSSENGRKVGEHRATFPPELIRRCVLPSSSPFGCCPDCLEPIRPVYRRIKYPRPGRLSTTVMRGREQEISSKKGPPDRHELIGCRPGCKHLTNPADAIPCTVLDPFCGSGTTGRVALDNGRRFIGLDGSLDYHLAAWHDLAPRADAWGRQRGR